jgi:hypothetical protein
MDFSKYTIFVKSRSLNREHFELLNSCVNADLINARKWLTRIDDLKIKPNLDHDKLFNWIEGHDFNSNCQCLDDISFDVSLSELADLKDLEEKVNLNEYLNEYYHSCKASQQKLYTWKTKLNELQIRLKEKDLVKPVNNSFELLNKLCDIIDAHYHIMCSNIAQIVPFNDESLGKFLGLEIPKLSDVMFKMNLKILLEDGKEHKFIPEIFKPSNVRKRKIVVCQENIEILKYLTSDIRSFIMDFHNSKFDRIVEILKKIGPENLTKEQNLKLQFLQTCHINSELGIIEKLDELSVAMGILLVK